MLSQEARRRIRRERKGGRNAAVPEHMEKSLRKKQKRPNMGKEQGRVPTGSLTQKWAMRESSTKLKLKKKFMKKPLIKVIFPIKTDFKLIYINLKTRLCGF